MPQPASPDSAHTDGATDLVLNHDELDFKEHLVLAELAHIRPSRTARARQATSWEVIAGRNFKSSRNS
jgi:hypothetical protein